MLTAVSHAPQSIAPGIFAEPDDPHFHEGIASQLLKLAVVDGLVAVTPQAWFPMPVDDDAFLSPRND